MQYRLLQALVAQRPLKHYHTLTDKPGFIQVLQRLIAEWKAARLEPTALRAAFSHMGNEPRLLELADIYAAYQEELQAHNWVDRAGRYWVAAEALNQHPHAAAAWPYLYIDGFDDFTPIQRNLLELLSQRVGHLIITLTGDDRAVSRYPRFAQTRQQIEKALNIQAQPLPHTPTNRPILHHLASRLFQPGPPKPITPGPPVTLIEAADIPGEVRHALRWLKARIVQDGYHPTQVALLARDIGPYRPFIRQIAQEMGIDLRLADGSPLGQSPVIVALLDLLRLFLPDAQNQPHLPRQGVISAWRSPYFKWRTCRVSPDGPRLDLKEGDAERLDAAARYGRVIAGLDQWQEALALLAAWGTEGEDIEDEDRQAPPPRHVPTGVFAQQLRDVFERFCQRLTPPISGSFREYVSWLETLIGPDPALAGPYPQPALTSLGIVAQVRANAATEADDLAALQMFKELLRGLVWAEDALAGSTGPISITYAHFMSELLSATQAHSYRPPLLPGQPAMLIADIPQSRGLSFAAVAVLGLGEGSFPQPVREDPFLRDNDRMTLRDRFNMPVELSTQSAEREFFYELLSRGREQMLLLRPRLADTGAEWVASPFWQTIRQLTGLTPVQTADDAAASAPEWLINLAQQPGPVPTEALTWLAQQHPELAAGWHIASELFQARCTG
ncbi:MAG: UvrD-helicase domain-containing protein [Chloroflexi bacterium]|nr:UvrD-helicase domain-containing protein [Chloroflexota bacterium]